MYFLEKINVPTQYTIQKYFIFKQTTSMHICIDIWYDEA